MQPRENIIRGRSCRKSFSLTSDVGTKSEIATRRKDKFHATAFEVVFNSHHDTGRDMTEKGGVFFFFPIFKISFILNRVDPAIRMSVGSKTTMQRGCAAGVLTKAGFVRVQVDGSTSGITGIAIEPPSIENYFNFSTINPRNSAFSYSNNILIELFLPPAAALSLLLSSILLNSGLLIERMTRSFSYSCCSSWPRFIMKLYFIDRI